MHRAAVGLPISTFIAHDTIIKVEDVLVQHRDRTPIKKLNFLVPALMSAVREQLAVSHPQPC